MRQLQKRCSVLGFAIVVLVISFGAQSLPAQRREQKVNEEVCASYINMFCIRCHASGRLCKALGIKDEEQWRKTVRKMAEYDRLDQDIQGVVWSCLAGRKAGDPLVCGRK